MITKDHSCSTNSKSSRALLVGYIFMGVVFLSSAVLGATIPQETENSTTTTERYLTEQELSVFDGRDGRPTYTAYNGIIYDVSTSPLFKEGEHFGHLAGKDLTSALAGAPHGEDVFAGFPIIGNLGSPTDTNTQKTPTEKFRERFLILGKTVTAWSGYLFGLVFIANFMTCYVMPWCASSVPWKGKIPGPDKWDQSIIKLSYYHRYFAWATIVLGIIHGVLGIFQSFSIIV